MKFATLDTSGKVISFYDAVINNGNIPDSAIEITDQQWQDLLNDQVNKRLVNGEVIEIERPVKTPEQIVQENRENMPSLTARQFWLAAHTLGISEEMLCQATDDPEILIEIKKSTNFYRLYDSVVMLADLMGITPEQLDDLWLWAANV